MKINQPKTSKTQNLAGGEAFILPVRERFVTGLMTSLWKEPKYYGDNTEKLEQDIAEMVNKDYEFSLKAAVYARTVMNLRTVPVVVLAWAALKGATGRPHLRQAMRQILTRPDQLKDFVAYVNSKKPKAMKSLYQARLGLADCFARFDAYQLGKYNSGGGVKLSDVVQLCHPKPENEEQSALWKALLEDKLPIPVTWETQVSAEGNKVEVWDRLIAENKLPYMAMLRNLRNLLNTKSTKLTQVAAILSDPERVAKSKQFPYRFYSAYREIESIPHPHITVLLEALHNALEHSAKNVPELGGLTLSAADNSGSMWTCLSSKSVMQYCDVANLSQAIFVNRNPKAIASVFGERFEFVNLFRLPILEAANKLKNTDVGHSTNGWRAIEYLIKNKLKVDRVVLFTDCQLWDSTGWGYGEHTIHRFAQKYWEEINPECWFHIIDLAGYGTIPIHIGNRVNLIAGWSDKILNVIKLTESGAGSMISEIEKITL